MFGYGFGDLEAVTEMRFNWLTVPVMSAAGKYGIFCLFSVTKLLNMNTAACVGQVFYAYRIFILSKSRIVPIFVTCVRCRAPSPWKFGQSLAHLFTGVLDELCGRYNHRRVLFPSRQHH